MNCARIVLILTALLTVNPAAADDSLGRIFFTPAQRAALDAGKQIKQPKTAKRTPRVRVPASITLNGIVVRSDGERTVWINERVFQGNRNPSGLRVNPSARTPAVADIQIRDKRKSVKLSVGQTYRRSSGEIIEAFESVAEPLKKPNSRDDPPKAPDN